MDCFDSSATFTAAKRKCLPSTPESRWHRLDKSDVGRSSQSVQSRLTLDSSLAITANRSGNGTGFSR